MVKPRITLRHSVEIATLYQQGGITIKNICEKFPQYSLSSIYRHAKIKIGSTETKKNKPHRQLGRPKIFSEVQVDHLVETLLDIRAKEGSCSSRRVSVKANLHDRACNKTICRALKSRGYEYLNTRRKGLMSALDFQKRLDFCAKVRRHRLGKSFWTDRISFYMDATGFQFKTNPLDQARAPKAREWRKRSEGLTMTAKGKKEGVTNANFMVGISYNKGVVLCESYTGSISGDKIAAMVKKTFPGAFKKSISPKEKRVLMDGCPRQNSKTARQAYDSVQAKIMVIPPRSPDLNPIENFFHLVKNDLRQQAIDKQITKENLKEFNKRVKKTLKNFPLIKINNIIASMDKRIQEVVDADGRRIKY